MKLNAGNKGLANLGNTCYMNSAIQCMSNTISLTNYFINNDYLEDYDTSKIEHNLVREWHRLLHGIWNNTDCVILPSSFHKMSNILSKQLGYNVTFGNRRQNDVQEFLQFMINTLHDALSSQIIVKISGNILNDLDKLALEAMEVWKTFFKDKYSIMIELFYSQLFSVTTCPDCNYMSKNYNPICYHTLPIPNLDNITLYDCFKKFTENETLDTNNMWKCEQCNELKCPQRRVLLWSSPNIMIICLKRFVNNLQKINTRVSFPIKNLNLKDFCIGYDKNSSVYNLYGVCNHTGGFGGGHYFAYCKHRNKKWYKYNDSHISEISESVIVSENAYCLFYEKVKKDR